MELLVLGLVGEVSNRLKITLGGKICLGEVLFMSVPVSCMLLSAGAVDECVPIVLARNVPRLKFTNADTRDKLLVPYEEDMFRVLYERFLD